jgi:WhiB family transcriptional regulator, redox-sensing transcriptional regulator
MSPQPGKAQASHRPLPQRENLSWQEQALCQGVEPELFFPSQGQVSVAKAAKQICGMCEVSDDCLRYALQHVELDGVWGGTSYRERRDLRRRPSERTA